MPIVYKMNILQRLKEAGYSTTRLRREKIIGEATIQQLRTNQLVSWATMNKICAILNCQPGDIIEYIEEDQTKKEG